MKFEKPIMSISIFNVENIVTDSTNFSEAGSKADTEITAINNASDGTTMAAKITVTF